MHIRWEVKVPTLPISFEEVEAAQQAEGCKGNWARRRCRISANELTMEYDSAELSQTKSTAKLEKSKTVQEENERC